MPEVEIFFFLSNLKLKGFKENCLFVVLIGYIFIRLQVHLKECLKIKPTISFIWQVLPKSGSLLFWKRIYQSKYITL